jgi:hypothetical protein
MNINDIARMADQVGIKLNNDHGCVTELSAAELEKLIRHVLNKPLFEDKEVTKKEIMEMAKAAELWITSEDRYKAVERFAKLIQEKEHQACIKTLNSDGWFMAAKLIEARGQI